MGVEIYERTRVEMVFYESGKKSVDGNKILKRAPYCFVEVALGKNFVMPYPMYDRLNFQNGSDRGSIITPDIVKVHVFNQKFLPFDGKTKVMYFGNV